MSNILEYIGAGTLITGFFGFIILLLFIGPLVTFWCYNYLAPIFNLPHLTLWQSFILFILIHTLTSGWGVKNK